MREYVKKVSQVINKLSNDQLKTVLESVTRENDLLESIYESLSQGIIVVDEDWRIVRINKMAERYLFCYNCHEDFKGDRVNLIELIKDKDIHDFFVDCINKDKGNVSSEFSIETSSGQVRFLYICVLPFFKKNKHFGYIIKVDDTTERVQQSIKLHRMENMAGLTNLAANMAHEIKNPLGAMDIHVQLIEKMVKRKRQTDGCLPEPKFMEDQIRIVKDEVKNLNGIVTDFLLAVRPINAELVLADPCESIKNVVEFSSLEFQRYRSELIFYPSDIKQRLLIDKKLFKQVLINITQNALHAIKARYEECSIMTEEELPPIGRLVIETSLKEDKYLITMTDNGCGMTEDVVSRIFEPYFTTKASGSGLGMTTVYKIIKEFQGDIQVESKLNLGTTFKIYIPIPQTETKLIKG